MAKIYFRSSWFGNFLCTDWPATSGADKINISDENKPVGLNKTKTNQFGRVNSNYKTWGLTDTRHTPPSDHCATWSETTTFRQKFTITLLKKTNGEFKKLNGGSICYYNLPLFACAFLEEASITIALVKVNVCLWQIQNQS